MTIMKPKKLQPGDTIGIVSPSEPIIPRQKEMFDRGVKFLESLGLKVKIGKNALNKYYYSAGTREERMNDFNTLWKDPEVKMVMMSHGGETANHLLDGIDYEFIRNSPKFFCGISDGTTLLTALFAKTGLVTYHGPDLLYTCGRSMSPVYRENFVKTFFDGNVGKLEYDPTWQHEKNPEIKNEGWRCLRGGQASGILMGGHVGCLISTIFSGFEPDFNGAVLFLEGTDDPGHLDRQFTALKLHGVFDKINGLILGWFEDFDNARANPETFREARDIILEVTKDYNFPILEINNLGHNVPNYVFPIGCQTTIDADKKIIKFDEPLVA